MLEELAINVSKIQLKLFLDNADTILGQARSKGIPLSDCVVWFDTRACPTKVDTRLYSDKILHGSSLSCLQGFEATRSEENITCLYCSSLFNGEVDEDGHEPNITMQKLYPHKWLLDFSTGNSKAQDMMNLLMSGTGETDKHQIKIIWSVRVATRGIRVLDWYPIHVETKGSMKRLRRYIGCMHNIPYGNSRV